MPTRPRSMPGEDRAPPDSSSNATDAPPARTGAGARTGDGWITPLATMTPTAIGRSYIGPSFRTSAGARLIKVRPAGMGYPELPIADRTRSRDSFTAASGRPTTISFGICVSSRSTSISTGCASIPWSRKLRTLGIIPNKIPNAEHKSTRLFGF